MPSKSISRNAAKYKLTVEQWGPFLDYIQHTGHISDKYKGFFVERAVFKAFLREWDNGTIGSVKLGPLFDSKDSVSKLDEGKPQLQTGGSSVSRKDGDRGGVESGKDSPALPPSSPDDSCGVCGTTECQPCCKSGRTESVCSQDGERRNGGDGPALPVLPKSPEDGGN